MSNLDKVVKRLEDVATRLETLSNQKPALPPKPTNTSGSNSKFKIIFKNKSFYASN
jgi:hypothetical protein